MDRTVAGTDRHDPLYQTFLPGLDKEPEFFETQYFGETFQLGTLAKGNGYDVNGFKLMAWSGDRGADYFIPTAGKSRNLVTGGVGGDRIAQFRNLALFLNGRKDGKIPFQFFSQDTARHEDAAGVRFVQWPLHRQ